MKRFFHSTEAGHAVRRRSKQMAAGAKGLLVIFFATPDFGAGACVSLILLLAWAPVLVLASAGVVWGARLSKNKSRVISMRGLIFMLASGSIPLFCCLAPPCIIRIEYGNWPIGSRPDGKIQEGMSREEVAAVLGTPHERVKYDGGESWYYWMDSYGLGWFCVRFGPEGRVIDTHGD